METKLFKRNKYVKWFRFKIKDIKLYDNEVSKGKRYIIGIFKHEIVFYSYNIKRT